jgi:hypothetical protein
MPKGAAVVPYNGQRGTRRARAGRDRANVELLCRDRGPNLLSVSGARRTWGRPVRVPSGRRPSRPHAHCPFTHEPGRGVNSPPDGAFREREAREWTREHRP